MLLRPVNDTLLKRLVFYATPIFFFLLFFVFPSQGQDLRFDHLGVEQGLSQGNTGPVLQDKYGFIWITTEDGLNLFDGYTFTVYRNSLADSFSISNNNTRCIAEDKAGNIWVGTLGGVNMFERKTNRFHRFQYDSTNMGSISSDEVNFIFFDSQNQLWISTARGLDLYDSTSHTFSHYLENPKNLSEKAVRAITEDGSKRIWVATASGLVQLNRKGNSRIFHHDPNNPESLSTNKIVSVYVDKDQNLWVGTFDGGMNKFDLKTEKITRYMHDAANPKSLGNNYVYAVKQNKAGELWIATDGALSKMNNDGTFTSYGKVEGDERALSSTIVTNVNFDSNDRMWVSTRFGGINVYDKDKYGFRHIRHLNHDPHSITNNTVTNFDEDAGGNLFISMDGGGINRLDRQTGHYIPVAEGQLSTTKVLALQFDNNGGLWAGTWAGGLNYYDPKTNRTKHYVYNENDPTSLSDNNIFDLAKDHKGNIWIATFGNGLNMYNAATNNFKRYVHDPDNANSVPSSPIGFIYVDKTDLIWLATERDGLCILNPATDKIEHFIADKKTGSLSANALFVVFEDSKGRIWIGTDGGGLNLFDREDKTFKAYRMSDGLPNESVFGILEDNDHNLWLSTNKGLSRFNPEKKTFKNFTTSDGLQSNQFTRWSFYKTSHNELLFGGTNGFNMFDPSMIKDNTFKPPVFITDFKLFNKPVPIGDNEILKTSILFTKEITLSYQENIFSFEFTALNYRQSEKNKYKYIMEGFQDEWIDAGTERKVSYTNLSPGDYTFRIIASNNDGVWNETGATVKIHIIPPFWKTIWFNALVVIAIGSGVVGYIRYQRKKAKRQQAELKAIIEEQTGEVKKQNEEILKKAEQEKIQNWITQGLAHISDVIAKQKGDLEEFSREVLKHLLKYVQAQQGIMAVAIKDDPSDEHLVVLSTYGVSKDHRKGERIEVGAGMIGAVYKDKEKKTMENLPPDYLRIESGLGNSTPARVILLPLKTDDGEIMGVMELAFLSHIPDTVQAFLDSVSSIIALNIHAVNLNHKTMLLLQQSKEQTEEMRAQEEEMRQNMEELEATQEEFRRRELEFQRRIEELENDLRSRQN